MKTVSFAVKGIATALLLASARALTASAADLVSVPDASYSTPQSGGGDSYLAYLSSDARYVLFNSTANNLARRTNGSLYLLPAPTALNAFLRDRTSGTTVLISADPSDTFEANADSLATGISTNGQFVLFESGASNLVSGDTNRVGDTDIFLRDTVAKTTSLVTVGVNKDSANGLSLESTMTPDGRYIAFSSRATNLVLGDTNGITDVFVRDMQSGVTRLVSVGALPAGSTLISPYGTGVSISGGPVITPDGRFVAFTSTATNLVTNVMTLGEIYLRDTVNNTTVCVSTNAHTFIPGAIECWGEKVSDDGQLVVYQACWTAATATNAFIFRHHVQTGVDDLVASNAMPVGNHPEIDAMDMTPDGQFIIFVRTGTGVSVWNALTATNTDACVDTNGIVPAKLTCQSPAISLGGRFAFFDCNATNLTTNTVGEGFHLYRRDLQAGITELIDAGTNGTALARTTQASSAMSADGRLIAFDCLDADLVTNDNNHACDVFLRDLNTETTELISAHEAGLPSRTAFRNGGSDNVTASADGRYFAFSCQGDALVSNYTNTYFDVFVRDLVAGTNSIVSLDTNGFADANGNSFQPVISADGHYLAFSSYATNLVSNDTNNGSAVFVRDLTSGVTTLASANSNGLALGGNSSNPSISSDGKYVLFLNGGSAILRDTVLGTNYFLATNGTTAAAMTPDGRYTAFYGVAVGPTAALYVWDSQLRAIIFTNATSAISRLCISSNGQRLAYISSGTISLADHLAGSTTNISIVTFVAATGLRFSVDGRWLVYATGTSKSPDDTNGLSDVYLYDAQTGTNSLISRSFYTGKAANGASDSPDISADGRYVVYTSQATDIAPADGNGRRDVFLYDQQAGSTTLLSVSSQLPDSANFVSLRPAFVGDGQTVVFHTWASDLAEKDFNQGDDLFVMKIASTNSPDSTNPPPAFSGEIILVPNGASQNPRLSWTVASGKTYRAQFKDDLADPNWQPVTGTMVIEGNKASILDLAPNPDHRFYRIQAF